MKFDAYTAFNELKKEYVNYLLDTSTGRFPARGDGSKWMDIRRQLSETWSAGDPENGVTSLFAEPLVECLFPFDDLYTLDDLEAKDEIPTLDRPLHPKLVNLLKETGMAGWKFFEHQKTAFHETVVSDLEGAAVGKSIVVSSGTGSGKTECFLIPMLNRMFWLEDEASLLAGGIRVLMVYPMNALVNNQLYRLADIMKSAARYGIKFGAYTGKTEEQLTNAKAAEPGTEMHALEQMPNFVKDRSGIRENPPHVLITNYSMLEYMLIRPADQPIFPSDENEWRKLQTVVLDEAHVYSGSLGNDIALLLRRVALKFRTSMDAVLGIATSATMSSDDPEKKMREIGMGLFSKEEGKIAGILGQRILPHVDVPSTWKWDLNALKTGDIEPGEQLSQIGCTLNGTAWDSINSCESAIAFRERLYESLPTGPLPLPAVAQLLGDNVSMEQAGIMLKLLGTIVDPASSSPFLAHKLHVYARRPFDLYSDLNVTDDSPLGSLYEEGEDRALLVQVQKKGGRREIYFCAQLQQVDDMLELEFRLKAVGRNYGTDMVYFRLATALDEGSIRFDVQWTAQDGGGYWKVISGGHAPFALALSKDDQCTVEEFWDQREQLEFRTIDGERLKTEAEGNQTQDDEYDPERLSPTLGSFSTTVSKDVAEVILVEALLPHLPAKYDPDGQPVGGPSEGRGILTFADTRQGAAWRASVLRGSHNRDVVRSFIYDYARNNMCFRPSRAIDENVRQFMSEEQFEDYKRSLQEPGAGLISLEEICAGLIGSTMFKREVGIPWDKAQEIAEPQSNYWQNVVRGLVGYELFGLLRRGRTLEAMGLVRSSYEGQLPPAPFDEPNPLSPDESALVNIFKLDSNFKKIWPHYTGQIIDYMRMGAALYWSYAGNDKEELKEFLGQLTGRVNYRCYVFQKKPTDERKYLGFTSRQGNIFVYSKRLFRKVLPEITDEQVEFLLRCLFSQFSSYAQANNDGIIRREFVDGRDELRVNVGLLKFAVYPQKSCALQINDFKGNLRVSYAGDEPSESNSRDEAGTFVDLSHDQLDAYRKSRDWRLRESLMSGIRTAEHTAQIDSKQLAKLEQEFIKGNVNVLSCSTTMELGIDIGDLTAVVLGNLAPASANYIQRVGRAGRRNEGSSIALTMLQSTPYDLSLFNDSAYIYKQQMRMGTVRLDDSRQIQRHLNSFLLSSFFNEIQVGGNNPNNAFGRCEVFFGNQARIDDFPGIKLDLESLTGWDSSRHECICDMLISCLTMEFKSEESRLLIEGTALEGLSQMRLQDSLMRSVLSLKDEYEKDWSQFNQQLSDAENAPHTAAAIRRQWRQLKRKQLIQFLGDHGVIPSYGFPTHVVPLYACEGEVYNSDLGKKIWEWTEPSRSAESALGEYAPGATIIKNQMAYTSSGLRFNSYDPEGGAFDRIYFIVCNSCKQLQTSDGQIEKCKHCGHEVRPWRPEEEEDQKLINEAVKTAKNTDDITTLPSIMRSYIRPKAFSTRAVPPSPATNLESRPYTVMQRGLQIEVPEGSLAALGSDAEAMLFGFLPEQKFLHYNCGRPSWGSKEGLFGYGYCLCLECGTAAQEESFSGSYPESFKNHRQLLGRNVCSQQAGIHRNVLLGDQGSTDVLVFRIPGCVLDEFALRKCETLGAALKLAATTMLQIESRSIGSCVQQVTANGKEYYDIMLYDAGMGDVGYMFSLKDAWLELLNEAIGKLDCSNPQCIEACHQCLLTYETSYNVKKGLIQRTLTKQWLEQFRDILYGKGVEIDGFQVRPAFNVVPSLRFQGQKLDVALPEFDADDIFGADGGLALLAHRAISGSLHMVRILVKASCITSPEDNLMIERLMHWYQDTEGRFELRLVNDLQPLGHLRLVRDGCPFFCAEKDFGVNALDKQEPIQWFAGKAEYRADAPFDQLWASAAKIEAPVYQSPESVKKVDIQSDQSCPPGFMTDMVGLSGIIGARSITSVMYCDRYLRGPASYRNLLDFIRELPFTEDSAIKLIVLGAVSVVRDNRPDTIDKLDAIDQVFNHSYADFEKCELQYVLNYIVQNSGLRFADVLWVPPREKHWMGHARRMIFTLSDDTYVSVAFDQGMDWARPKQVFHGAAKSWYKPVFDEDREFITNDSYAVRSTDISIVELGILEQGYEPPDFVEVLKSTL